MKKIGVSLITTFGFLAIAASASADNFCSTSGSFGNLCLDASSLGKTIGNIVNLLFLLAGLIALVNLITGGIKWITSEGDAKNVEAARNQIIGAAIGLGITFLSYLIINILFTFFLGNGLNSISLPKINQ